jgi:hypothetical protein
MTSFYVCANLILSLYGSRLVRESIPDATLGLFVHTPFPSSEVFRCLPRMSTSNPKMVVQNRVDILLHLGRKEILDGMLGANLVCFQVCVMLEFFINPPVYSKMKRSSSHGSLLRRIRTPGISCRLVFVSAAMRRRHEESMWMAM